MTSLLIEGGDLYFRIRYIQSRLTTPTIRNEELAGKYLCSFRDLYFIFSYGNNNKSTLQLEIRPGGWLF